jgi:hypothetical protein
VVDQMKICRLIDTADSADLCERAAREFELEG